jgi:hypothetical protein
LPSRHALLLAVSTSA